MIELLIVMSIIALLAGLYLAAIGPAIQGARVAGTKATLNVIQKIIDERVQAINNIDLSVEARMWAARTGVPVSDVEFILRKNFLRMALPQSKEDLYGLDRQPNTFDDSPLTAWDDTFGLNRIDESGSGDDGPPPLAAAPSIPWDDTQLLWRALTAGSVVRSHGVNTAIGVTQATKSYSVPILAADDVPVKFRREHGALQLTELIDSWEQPLAFYTWPTRLVRPGGNGAPITAAERQQAQLSLGVLPGSLDQDPIDPTGTKAAKFSVAIPIDFNGDMTPDYSIAAFTEANYHTLATWSRPFLLSPGPDETLGLEFPDAAAPGRLALPTAGDSRNDNVTSGQ